jgi:hypothetical protein
MTLEAFIKALMKIMKAIICKTPDRNQVFEFHFKPLTPPIFPGQYFQNVRISRLKRSDASSFTGLAKTNK